MSRIISGMHILCALVFCLFSFSYLYFYQSDVLAVAQHVASDGKTYYIPFVYDLIITIILLLLQICVFKISKLYLRFHWLTYLPSLLILTFITDVPPSITEGIELGVWIWVFPLTLAIIAFAIYLARNYQEIEPLQKEALIMSNLLWMNIIPIGICLTLMGFISSNDLEFHKQAHIERLILQGEYEKAYDMTFQLAKDNQSALMLRSYALWLGNQLGERLFEHPIYGTSKMLAPGRDSIKTYLLPEEPLKRRVRLNVEYVLCRKLIDRDMKSFSFVLHKYYPQDVKLQKHYREALALDNDMTSHCDSLWRDSVTEVSLSRFKFLLAGEDSAKMCKSPIRINKNLIPHPSRLKLKEQFGNTYWYYYYKLED